MMAEGMMTESMMTEEEYDQLRSIYWEKVVPLNEELQKMHKPRKKVKVVLETFAVIVAIVPFAFL